MSGGEGGYAWGPTIGIDGKTRFRLWAPAEKQVRLRIAGENLPMARLGDGWFEAVIAAPPFGTQYGFVLDDGTFVPDPASRRQNDVLGPSTLVDPSSFAWTDQAWKGRPWKETVFQEIHIGTFTPEGTFRAAAAKLSELADLGFTAIEVMPLAHFPGARGWGYDGVFHYAPYSPYGSADDFKAFVDTAHGLGLMVFMDVVYNHFGPVGNFLSVYAPDFFHTDNPTPWGPRIAFEREPVRRYFIDNAIYWLTEYHLDGLRLDAVDQIEDRSAAHILEQLSREARAAVTSRPVHLAVENPVNGTDLLAACEDGLRLYEADWNDDFHHAIHAAVTEEKAGHYARFAEDAWGNAARALAQGYLSDGRRVLPIEPPPSETLPRTSFIQFLQNHDQVGNRAGGDRLHHGIDPALHAALVEMLVLSPPIPMLFQGDDHLTSRPFRFFADYEGKLREDYRKHREVEARNFGGLTEDMPLPRIFDPSEPATFEACKLDWSEADRPEATRWRAFLKRLFRVRRERIVPLIDDSLRGGDIEPAPDRCIFVDWPSSRGVLKLRANLSAAAVELEPDMGEEIYPGSGAGGGRVLGPCGVRLYLAV